MEEANWKEEFGRALLDVLARDGTPVRATGDTYYSWIHDDWQRISTEVASVGLDYEASSWEEEVWSEFQGTCYEGDESVYGITAKLVLKNGASYEYRYNETISTLILAVVGTDAIQGR
jgi:hypothetical protein